TLADGGAQLLAQADHAGAHLVELGLPFGAQFGILEDGADDFGAMIGRLAIGATDDVEQLRLGDVGLSRVAGDEDGGADALRSERWRMAALSFSRRPIMRARIWSSSASHSARNSASSRMVRMISAP